MKYLIIIILALAAAHTEAQLTDSVSGRLLQQEMVYWTATNDSVKCAALLNKAAIARQVGLYDKALNELSRAEPFCKGDELARLNYERMVNYFLSDDYYTCSSITIDSSKIPQMYKEYLFMKLCALNESEKWTTCRSMLLSACNKGDTAQLKVINNLPVSYKYKSPAKSKKLSNIIPGLGEIYAGYPGKGITSFILNAGFLFFAGYNYYTGYYITGTVSGLFPVLKFHAGGKRLSYILADEHNEKESRKVKNKYWEEINSIVQ